jgi:SAM-dependent methyltransferase
MPIVSAGQRVLPPAGQRIVGVMQDIATAVGHPLDTRMRVLDFGAGAGRHVAEFRQAGYDALGVDQIHSSHAEGSVETDFLRRVEPPDYILPFDDATFDFVYSITVMEHVLDPGQALAQIARVTRPGGLSVHVFPSRWRPIEPHMYVPFGGRFQSFALMRLWAALGIRNSLQRGLAPIDVALGNVQYAKTGIHYPTTREWEHRAQRLFSHVEWVERHYLRATRDVSRVSRITCRVIRVPGAETAYRTLHTQALALIR